MSMEDNDKSLSSSLEENLKKALTEMLLLCLLSTKECYIGELTAMLRDKSNGVLSIVFPYSAIYRLEQSGYLVESNKRIAPDGRRRQFYRITDAGRIYLDQLTTIYSRFTKCVSNILEKGGELHE